MSKDYSNLEGLVSNVKESIRNAYDKGYKQGFNEGQAHQLASDDVFRESCEKSAYEKGLNDAWECVNKIFNMDFKIRRKILGVDAANDTLVDIANAFSAAEAISKIKEYEEKQKAEDIKVGDEILIHNIQDAETYKAVVMDIDMDKGLWIFDENACNTVIEPNRYIGEEADIEVRKTGRHFDQIDEVLEKLKEGQDETK